MDEDLASVMPADELDALVETCVWLKQRLVSFTRECCREELRRSTQDSRDENRVNAEIDDLIHAPAAPGCESLIDVFLAEACDLTAPERDLVRGWKDALIGVFEVKARKGRLLRALNLVDDLEFRLLMTSDAPALWARLSPGVFVLSRAVPAGDLWMLSGTQSLMTAQDEAEAGRLSMQLVSRNPAWFFRNPLNLERARQLTRERFDAFVARYDRSWLSGTPDEVRNEVDAFNASRVKAPLPGGPGQPSQGLVPATLTLPEPLLRQTSISFFSHPSAGTTFFGGTARLIEAFDRPERAGLSPWRDELQHFLSGAGVAGGAEGQPCLEGGVCNQNTFCWPDDVCRPSTLTDRGDGTLADPASGLVWTKEEIGPYSYSDARQRCESLSLGGTSGWRLPSIEELQTLFWGCQAIMKGGDCPIDDSCGFNEGCKDCLGCWVTSRNVCFRLPGFSAPCSDFWSSTAWMSPSLTHDFAPVALYYVVFEGGQILNDEDQTGHHALCVR